ncbi:MAG: hypothetical protein WDA27_02230 [Actinomycetota bacterium]
MLRRLAALAAMSALVLVLSASPSLASPVRHASYPATEIAGMDGPITCGPTSYTFTSGRFSFVFRDLSVGAHINLINVRARDGAGAAYRVVGAETYSDPTRLVGKIRFISQGGGVADSIDIVGHLSPNGRFHFFDFGTCSF